MKAMQGIYTKIRKHLTEDDLAIAITIVLCFIFGVIIGLKWFCTCG